MNRDPDGYPSYLLKGPSIQRPPNTTPSIKKPTTTPGDANKLSIDLRLLTVFVLLWFVSARFFVDGS